MNQSQRDSETWAHMFTDVLSHKVSTTKPPAAKHHNFWTAHRIKTKPGSLEPQEHHWLYTELQFVQHLTVEKSVAPKSGSEAATKPQSKYY